MITCPNCNHHHREGYLFCENCGGPLGSKDIQIEKGTIVLNKASQDLMEQAMRPNLSTLQAEDHGLGVVLPQELRVTHDAVIELHVADAEMPIVLAATGRTVLGRSDSRSANRPDVDLSPYNAINNGVSRIHAAIDSTDNTLTVVDLGSSNGTYLNGRMLTVNQPSILRNGDEISFGSLVTHIHLAH